MQECEEKKSEEVLERNAADEKAMCVRKKYGDTWLFYIFYTGFIRVVKYLTKNNVRYCVKVPKQYNIIGKNLVLLFNMEKQKNPI